MFGSHHVNISDVKDMNAREERRLDWRIAGHIGIEEQKRITLRQTQLQCDLLRRELAEVYFGGNKRKSREQRSHNCLCDYDPDLLMIKERENIRRKKNRRLLYRAKQKEKLMDDLVKEFISKLDQDTNSADSKQGSSDEVVSDPDPQPQLEDAQEPVAPLFRSGSHVWREAWKTRYIRTKLLRDFEVELTPKQVFADGS